MANMTNIDEELVTAYVTHLRGEHRQVNDCLQRVEQRWREYGRRRGMPRKEQLIASLTELRAALARHLAEEEAGGCVEEAVLHAPRLSHAAVELEREDPQLLAGLDGLIKKLREMSRWNKKCEQDYRNVAAQIRAHAHTESQVVEEGLGMEVD